MLYLYSILLLGAIHNNCHDIFGHVAPPPLSRLCLGGQTPPLSSRSTIAQFSAILLICSTNLETGIRTVFTVIYGVNMFEKDLLL